MKKYVLMTLLMAASLQANAAYNCLDKVTGKEAGKFEELATNDGSEKIIYMSDRNASDGWVLLVANNGNLYNADDMVKHGKDFWVGKVEMKSFYFALTIQGRELVCE